MDRADTISYHIELASYDHFYTPQENMKPIFIIMY